MYDNKSQIFGKSYEDWTAEWWEWAYSTLLIKTQRMMTMGLIATIVNMTQSVFFWNI